MFPLKKPKKRLYDYEHIFSKLMFQLETLDNASENVFEILKTILNVVDARSGSLFLYQPNNKLFIMKKWVGERPLNVSVSQDYEFIHFLKRTQNVVFKDEALSENRFIDIRSAGIHYFTQLSCAAVVPLIVKNEWVGLMNAGRGLSQMKYDEQDRTMLMLLGYWLAHNLSNTFLYNKIITQNKRLAEVAELKNQLMANVTHELRTPLNGIIGLTDMIIDESDGPVNEDQKRHMGMIKSAGESLLEIVDKMLSLIKVESNRNEIDVKRLDLSRMVNEIAELFEGILGSQENRFQSSLNGNEIVYGDEDQVRTIFMNLVGNAVKFTKKGQIEVHAVRSGEMLKVCVKDTGIGISDEDQDKIFDEFRQADGSITRSYGGTGLGLSIAKKIVEKHGGRIWVDSVLGKGSEFYFTLPTKPAGIQAIEVG